MIIRQQTPLSMIKSLYEATEMLNINFSYGMACNLQRVIQSLMSFEHEEQKRLMLMNLEESPDPNSKDDLINLRMPILQNMNKVSM